MSANKDNCDTVLIENTADVLVDEDLHKSSPSSSKVAKNDSTNSIAENRKQQVRFDTHWYKGMILHSNLVILIEICFQIGYERKDKRQRHIMKYPV